MNKRILVLALALLCTAAVQSNIGKPYQILDENLVYINIPQSTEDFDFSQAQLKDKLWTVSFNKILPVSGLTAVKNITIDLEDFTHAIYIQNEPGQYFQLARCVNEGQVSPRDAQLNKYPRLRSVQNLDYFDDDFEKYFEQKSFNFRIHKTNDTTSPLGEQLCNGLNIQVEQSYPKGFNHQYIATKIKDLIMHHFELPYSWKNLLSFSLNEKFLLNVLQHKGQIMQIEFQIEYFNKPVLIQKMELPEEFFSPLKNQLVFQFENRSLAKQIVYNRRSIKFSNNSEQTIEKVENTQNKYFEDKAYVNYTKDLIGQGYHQSIQLNISLIISMDMMIFLRQKDACYLYILDYVDDSAYVDYDEFNMNNRNEDLGLIIYETMDIEQPITTSRQYLYTLINYFSLQEQFERLGVFAQDHFRVQLNHTYPINFRYRKPGSARYETSYLNPHPQFYLDCFDPNVDKPRYKKFVRNVHEMIFEETLLQDTHLIINKSHKLRAHLLGTPALKAHIPTGQIEFQYLTLIVTIAVTLGLSIFIMKQINLLSLNFIPKK